MRVRHQPDLIVHGAAAMLGHCGLKIAFEFAGADDLERGAAVVTDVCKAFAIAGALGAYALTRHARAEATMGMPEIRRADERCLVALVRAANVDATAFQFLRNMLGSLVTRSARLQRIRVLVEGAGAASVERLPVIDDLNESHAYPRTWVTPDDFELVWADSEFSKARRVLLAFGAPPPTDVAIKLQPYVLAWFGLLERGAFCAPYGLPFETESVGDGLSVFDETSYEISIRRFVASEAGFHVLANMLGHFSRNVLAIESVEID